MTWHVNANWLLSWSLIVTFKGKPWQNVFTYPWITLQRYFLSTPSIESYFLLTTKEWNSEGLIRMQPKAWLNFCLKISLASPTFSSGWKVCTGKQKKSIRYLEILKIKIYLQVSVFSTGSMDILCSGKRPLSSTLCYDKVRARESMDDNRLSQWHTQKSL